MDVHFRLSCYFSESLPLDGFVFFVGRLSPISHSILTLTRITPTRNPSSTSPVPSLPSSISIPTAISYFNSIDLTDIVLDHYTHQEYEGAHKHIFRGRVVEKVR